MCWGTWRSASIFVPKIGSFRAFKNGSGTWRIEGHIHDLVHIGMLFYTQRSACIEYLRMARVHGE
jgi:hypothetical protein